MISEVSVGVLPEREERQVSRRISAVLGVGIFVSILLLIAFTAIPYGTAEAWWKGFFVCCVYAVAILWIIDGYLSGTWATGGRSILLPMIGLAALAVVQTISIPVANPVAGVSIAWNSISADPFATRFFVLQLSALILVGALLFRYASTETRMITLTHVIIGIVVLSALFGIVRQTTQHSRGFFLALAPDQGYGQFVNRNHFAFLMEMGFGLVLGIVAGRGVRRERGLIYLGALLPIWTALVLSNSRGGLIAMAAQVLSTALLSTLLFTNHRYQHHESKASRLLRSLPARVVMVFVLMAGVVFGTLWLGGDRLATKIEHGGEVAESEVRQNSKRNQIWAATWRMFEAHPIAGVGLAGYWIAISGFHDASGVLSPQEAHNDYLELLASGGVIGFAFGVWFIVAVFRRARANLMTTSGFRRAACFGASIGLIGVAVHSLVDFGLHMIVNALIFTALVVIATCDIKTKQRIALND